MGEELEARLAAVRTDALRINGDDDALRAEFLGGSLHEAPILDRGGVDRDFVGTRLEQSAHVLGAAYPAADGERHEAALGRAAHHVEDRAALLVACGDVEE